MTHGCQKISWRREQKEKPCPVWGKAFFVSVGQFFGGSSITVRTSSLLIKTFLLTMTAVWEGVFNYHMCFVLPNWFMPGWYANWVGIIQETIAYWGCFPQNDGQESWYRLPVHLVDTKECSWEVFWP